MLSQVLQCLFIVEVIVRSVLVIVVSVLFGVGGRCASAASRRDAPQVFIPQRFRRLLERVEGGTMFKNGTPIAWRCRNCGFVTEAPEAPEKCPVCAHPQSYFEVKAENF